MDAACLSVWCQSSVYEMAHNKPSPHKLHFLKSVCLLELNIQTLFWLEMLVRCETLRLTPLLHLIKDPAVCCLILSTVEADHFMFQCNLFIYFW